MMGPSASQLSGSESGSVMSEIPVKVSEKQFDLHFAPYLSHAKRGYVCQIPLYRVFNYILHWLHTGCQWAELPIEPSADAEKKKSVTPPSICILPIGVAMTVSNTCGNRVSVPFTKLWICQN
jgi:hypothetical protein